MPVPRSIAALPAVVVAALAAAVLPAQTEPSTGIRDNTPRVHALRGARLVVAPGRVLERGTVVVRDGIIEAAGAAVPVPADARIHDCSGLTIWPGLIEPWLPAVPAKTAPAAAVRPGRSWNPRVHPERSAADGWQPETRQLEELRAIGFTVAAVVPATGIFRGRAAVATLGAARGNRRFLVERSAAVVALERSGSRREYPASLMGVLALIRQTLADAGWYRRAQDSYRRNPRQERPETNESLAALAPVLDHELPLFFEVGSALDLLRARRIAAEFGLDPIYEGSGVEYRRLGAIGRASVIVPVVFPEAPAVDTAEDALDVSLRDLRRWDRAPENPARLVAAGVEIALTSAGLDKRSDFPAKVREAIERGLAYDEALRALTETPARMLGLGDRLGTIAAGKVANLVVTDGDLFAEDSKVRETWIDGDRYPVTRKPLADPRGAFSLDAGAAKGLRLEITGKEGRLGARLAADGKTVAARTVRLTGRRLALSVPGAPFGRDGVVRMSGAVEARAIAGAGAWADGSSFRWRATRVSSEKPDAAERKTVRQGSLADASCELPEGAFGRAGPPAQQHVVVRNATIWTCGHEGRLDRADMVVDRGRIVALGRQLAVPDGTKVIDATGKHVTPGLIDAHSHTAIAGGVNEGTQAVTAEVRIGDVLDPDDVNIYRELAGGLTTANLLHGSANPIGGQSCVVKLRWGVADPEDMKFRGATPGIKFALGENVKQSNWGDDFTTRYPQTRMGVEQIIRDRFQAAREYAARLDASKRQPDRIPPRRDLELDALVEVLRGERKVHCHSYRQDEILMLVRVADDFGFTVGTFQHVLEGYKVADVLKKHGAMASTFSDWWAYKYEVVDAIPYNGALLDRVGVVTSFNSDSSELARRLNTEAAKAVKYGGLTEEEALGFVTLHPARQLGVAGRVGSLAAGKDADFVVWSGNPLSTLSVCEQTWIDGRRYFDRDENRALCRAVRNERARLVQRVLLARDKKKQRRRKEALEKLGAGGGEGRR